MTEVISVNYTLQLIKRSAEGVRIHALQKNNAKAVDLLNRAIADMADIQQRMTNGEAFGHEKFIQATVQYTQAMDMMYGSSP